MTQPRLDQHLNGCCVGCGRPIGYQEREALQAPYRGLWQAMCQRVTDMPLSVPVYQRDLMRWLVDLQDEQPDARAMIAVRTTEYGGEAGRMG